MSNSLFKNKALNFLLLCSLFSCNAWRAELVETGDIKDARYNAIVSFYNTHKTKNKAFRIKTLKDNDDLFCFSIKEIDVNKIFPSVSDTIGGYAKPNFYTESFKIKKTLFLWHDASKVITKEIITEMQTYDIIDSTYIRANEEELSDDELPVWVNDDSKKSTFYFVCKDKISRHKAINSNYVLSPNDYPKIDCNLE